MMNGQNGDGRGLDWDRHSGNVNARVRRRNRRQREDARAVVVTGLTGVVIMDGWLVVVKSEVLTGFVGPGAVVSIIEVVEDAPMKASYMANRISIGSTGQSDVRLTYPAQLKSKPGTSAALP